GAETAEGAGPTMAVRGDPGPSSEQVPVNADDPVWGDPNAPVTLVTFQDFQCPFCARVHPTIKQLEQDYGPGTLRVVFKHNPLPFHQDALPAAVASQAVFEVAGSPAFFAYADLLFRGQRNLSDDNLIAWAEEVGVDRASLFRTVRQPAAREKVARDMDLAQAIGASGTPAFRINGATLVGAQPIEKFKELIDQERAAARALRGQGVSPEQIYPTRVAKNYVPPAESKPAASAPREDDTTVWKVPLDKSPVLGPPTALVTIVEFSDFECPFCRRVQSTVDEVMDRYKGKVRLVFKHNPLPFHKGALPAALVSIEARTERGDKGFWDAAKALYAEQTPMTDEQLLDVAKRLKLNGFRVKQVLAKETHKKVVEADQDLATDLEARGVPHFFINGRRLSGAQPIERFAKLIDEEIAKAEDLVKKGTPKARIYATLMKDAKGPPPPETKTVPAPGKANPSRGPANAPIVVQMFSDFQCPFCQRAVPTVESLEKAFPGRVRVVWRNFPLPFHTHARLAAAAALEAFAQKGNAGFWKMHDLLFAGQKQPDGLERAALEGYAQQIGLDMSKFRAALDDGRHDAAIQKDEAIAKTAGINGTPAFVINGYFVSGAQPLGAFKKVVNLALDDIKKGKKKP
ncbi:MAG: thioredoxin domain-containing protein, partial [Myxococcales bacterium]|nr:thioredoxin domain-containing protein [Myxococcales bacterium]